MLSTGMARAQEAVQITVPTAPVTAAPATPPPAAPTIVLPEAAPASPAATPAAPVVAETVAPPPTRAPRAASTAPRTARAVEAAAPVAAAPVVDRAPAPVTAQPVPVEPVPAAQVAPPPAAAVATSDTPDWALPVGAAATLLVLGGIGLAMTRRRRAWEADADFVPPMVNRPATRPMAERPVVTERPAAAPMMANSAAPASADDRAELINRMVAAQPDASNPFTSAKARRRRARLIVQSMPKTAQEPASIRAPQYSERPLQDHRVLASL
ncbi:hypothetical protein GGQ88_001029 [Novosphingobium hassiacum]|uniref:LPXTG cell wall anchor domain-containing protein n=1 Tax=Novosphingobium hassiacum TaxID=173676 RepID=A0A7W5ZVC3_9SPHN|nr:hypothetical protein [Novosphingobium hassiacum]MBB3859768.1 hypothetical protein [Novosphingobium hassiacum]